MSAGVDKLGAKLAELKGERDALASTPTREDAARRAAAWLEAARARAAESAGLVANGHVHGDALQAVLLDPAGGGVSARHSPRRPEH